MIKNTQVVYLLALLLVTSITLHARPARGEPLQLLGLSSDAAPAQPPPSAADSTGDVEFSAYARRELVQVAYGIMVVDGVATRLNSSAYRSSYRYNPLMPAEFLGSGMKDLSSEDAARLKAIVRSTVEESRKDIRLGAVSPLLDAKITIGPMSAGDAEAIVRLRWAKNRLLQPSRPRFADHLLPIGKTPPPLQVPDGLARQVDALDAQIVRGGQALLARLGAGGADDSIPAFDPRTIGGVTLTDSAEVDGQTPGKRPVLAERWGLRYTDEIDRTCESIDMGAALKDLSISPVLATYLRIDPWTIPVQQDRLKVPELGFLNPDDPFGIGQLALIRREGRPDFLKKIVSNMLDALTRTSTTTEEIHKSRDGIVARVGTVGASFREIFKPSFEVRQKFCLKFLALAQTSGESGAWVSCVDSLRAAEKDIIDIRGVNRRLDKEYKTAILNGAMFIQQMAMEAPEIGMGLSGAMPAARSLAQRVLGEGTTAASGEVVALEATLAAEAGQSALTRELTQTGENVASQEASQAASALGRPVAQAGEENTVRTVKGAAAQTVESGTAGAAASEGAGAVEHSHGVLSAADAKLGEQAQAAATTRFKEFSTQLRSADLRNAGVDYNLRSASAAVDRQTGRVYTGINADGAPRGLQTNSLLAEYKQSLIAAGKGNQYIQSLENCAEWEAINNALNNGARPEDLVIATVKNRSGTPFPACENCQNFRQLGITIATH